MLNLMYKFATPWAIANKVQVQKNRILGRIANYIYPAYCSLVPIKERRNDNCGNVIVSLTSFPARIDKVYLCINSILRQNRQADKIILWLADSQFPNKSALPRKLLDLEKKGLEIRFCEDLKSYKKVFFTAQEYPDSIIITADDDTLYPENWIEDLYSIHREFPPCVCCYRAHKMTLKDSGVAPYEDWICMSPGEKGPSILLLPVGVGGVLYPPEYFKGIDFEIEAIKKVCPTADDLWLKVVGFKKNISVVKVFPYSKEWFTLKGSQKKALFSINTKGQNLNDVAMHNLVDYYHININAIISDEENK